MINVILDEHNRVRGYSTMLDSFEGGINVEVDETFDPKKDYAYLWVDGHLVYSEAAEAEFKQRLMIEELRERRESECFAVINRSIVWHKMLTDAEEIELFDWYQAWLDAPETGIIPEKPEWLK